MPWVEVLAAFVVCHVVGDFLLQTDWQANNKPRGLGRDPERRRALISHIAVYTLSFVPALVWIASESDGGTAAAAAAGIAIPHLLQDDGRAVRWWMSRVKRADPDSLTLTILVDQSAHLVVLFALAVAVGR